MDKNEQNLQPAAGGDGLISLLTIQTTIIAFWVTFVLYSLVSTYAPVSVTGSKWFGIPARSMLQMTIALWVFADGRARNFRDEEWLKMYFFFAFIAAPITVPIYLVKSRGWKESAKTSLRFIGYFVLVVVILLLLEMVLKGVR